MSSPVRLRLCRGFLFVFLAFFFDMSEYNETIPRLQSFLSYLFPIYLTTPKVKPILQQLTLEVRAQQTDTSRFCKVLDERLCEGRVRISVGLFLLYSFHIIFTIIMVFFYHHYALPGKNEVAYKGNGVLKEKNT